MATFTVTASGQNRETVQYVLAKIRVTSRDAADRIATGFPKFVRAKVIDIVGDPTAAAAVEVSVWLSGDGVNKGKNETGLKRLRALLTVVPWEYDETAYASSPSREAFDRFVQELL